MSKAVYTWDIAVRVFHWSLVTLFAANLLIIDEESILHIWVGYGVFGLIVFRLIWGLVGTRPARFTSFPPSVAAARAQAEDMLAHRHAPLGPSHTPLGAVMVYNLIATLIAISVTGYLATTDAFFGVDWMVDFHEVLVNWATISIVLHIAGVIYESRRHRQSLAKAMITGYRQED